MSEGCRRTLCTDDAEMIPVFVLRVRGQEDRPARAAMDLKVCPKHAAEMTVAALLNDSMWNQIVMGLVHAGKQAPARELTTLEVIRIDSEEARQFFRVATQLPKSPLH